MTEISFTPALAAALRTLQKADAVNEATHGAADNRTKENRIINVKAHRAYEAWHSAALVVSRVLNPEIER